MRRYSRTHERLRRYIGHLWTVMMITVSRAASEDDGVADGRW